MSPWLLKPQRVADVGVVVVDRDRVVELRPAEALQVDREVLARRGASGRRSAAPRRSCASRRTAPAPSTWPSWISCTACQPPRPSGTVIFVLQRAVGRRGRRAERDRSRIAQQVPVQLTRLPTTDAHCRSTGAFGVSPPARDVDLGEDRAARDAQRRLRRRARLRSRFRRSASCTTTWSARRSPASRSRASAVRRPSSR